MPTPIRTRVFICYSHRDAKYLERLQVHLHYYDKIGVIDFWDDTKLLPGAKWREEINKALSHAKIAILLVSADFLASRFIAENELPPLLTAAEEEGTIILPVILSSCAFEDTALSEFQAVNDPLRPIIKMNKNDREKTWAEVARTVKHKLNLPQSVNTLS